MAAGRGKLARSNRDRPWHYCVAGALMVAGPVARQLYYARYPLDTMEAVFLIVGLATAGAVVGAASAVLGRYLGGLVFGGLLLVFLDLQFDFPSLAALWIGGALALLVALLLPGRRATITALTLAAFYSSSLPFRTRDDLTVRKAGPSPTTASSLRPIVHLILDEHLSIGGFRGMGDTATAAFLTDFYTRRGFDVYPGAYSRFNDTRPSVTAVLSLGEVDGSALLGPSRAGSPDPLVINPYFARVAGQGRPINVYQSANLDYCSTPGIEIATCGRVPATSVANISYLRIPWRAKARLVLEFVIVSSSQLRLLHPRYRDLERRRVFAPRGVELLRAAGEDLVRRRNRADLFFVHLLLPHGPYEMDQECVPYLERLLGASDRGAGRVPDSLRTSREARYRAQVRCTYRVVGRFLDQVDQAFGPNQAIVIVQGDHGSRAVHRCPPNVNCKAPTATREHVATFRPVDFAAEFATLLAIRSPDAKGSIHWGPVPVQDLLWAFVRSDFNALPSGPWNHYIYLADSGDRQTYPLRPADMLWVQETAAISDSSR